MLYVHYLNWFMNEILVLSPLLVFKDRGFPMYFTTSVIRLRFWFKELLDQVFSPFAGHERLTKRLCSKKSCGFGILFVVIEGLKRPNLL